MATQKQLAAAQRARDAAAGKRAEKAERLAEMAAARERLTIDKTAQVITEEIEEYKRDAMEEGIEEPLPPLRQQPEPSMRVPIDSQPTAEVEWPQGSTPTNVQKIVLTSGWGNYPLVIDLVEMTYEDRSNNRRGDIKLLGDGPVLAIDGDNLRKSQFGHWEIDGDGGERALAVTRYARVKDIQEFKSKIVDTQSSYDLYQDESALFEDEDEGLDVVLHVNEDDESAGGRVLDLDSDDAMELPIVTLDDEEKTSDDIDGDDEGEMIDPDTLQAMQEIGEEEMLDSALFEDDEEEDDNDNLTEEEQYGESGDESEAPA